jgi:hypothetical protein
MAAQKGKASPTTDLRGTLSTRPCISPLSSLQASQEWRSTRRPHSDAATHQRVKDILSLTLKPLNSGTEAVRCGTCPGAAVACTGTEVRRLPRTGFLWTGPPPILGAKAAPLQISAQSRCDTNLYHRGNEGGGHFGGHREQGRRAPGRGELARVEALQHHSSAKNFTQELVTIQNGFTLLVDCLSAALLLL